jgi:phosphohistidine phosphatase
MEPIALAINRVVVFFYVFLSSHNGRAPHTAIIAHDALARGNALEITDTLASGAEREKLIAELKQRFRHAESIMIVGHEPDLSGLVAQITGLGRGHVEMKKAGLAKIAISTYARELAGVLEWLVPPKIFLQIK